MDYGKAVFRTILYIPLHVSLMTLPCLKPSSAGTLLLVQAVPRSSRTEVVDVGGDRCRMKVKAPPVDGEANAAIVAFLAKTFGLPKARVVLKVGERGKQKNFLLEGLDPVRVESVLLALLSKTDTGKKGS